MKFQDVYKQGLDQGFEITNVRTYLSNGKQVIATNMSTPFFNAKGIPVTGYADIPVTHGQDLRESQSVEFFADGHNLDYESGGNAKLFTKGGLVVDVEDARKAMGNFAAAGSKYPHVELYDDWKKLQEKNYERLKIDEEPTEADYERYLDMMESQLMSKDFQFVGQITSRNDLTIARQSTPSFSQMMDEMSQLQNDVQLE